MLITQNAMCNYVQFIAIVGGGGDIIMCKAKQHYSFEIWDLHRGFDEN